MMRLNAPIPATLALAAVSLFPACSLAKPAHRIAHTTTAAPATTHSAHHKTVAEPVHESRRHASGKASPPAVVRVREERHEDRADRASSHHLRHVSARRSSQPELTAAASDAAAAPQKATSQDFLKAAAEHAQSPEPTQHAEEPVVVERHTRRTASVAKPVPVVSVIRPTAETPQLASVEETVSTPVLLPTLYNKRGRLIVPPPLKGSHEILIHQNEVADRDGLHRIQNDDDLLDMRTKRLLVALPDNNAVQVDERLPLNRRYSRPWTAQFLATVGRAHYAHFHSALTVTSAVRTVEFQEHLIHINGNAAPAEGDTASPHLTGQAIDIAKHGLSLTEIAWMRGYLLPLVQEGKIDVEEEFQQSCFHISVYKRYLPAGDAPERDIAIAHHGGTSALATALR